MWSYRLNKVKSGDLDKSITNSDSLAEEQANQTYADTQNASVLSVIILIIVLVGNLILNKATKGNVSI